MSSINNYESPPYWDTPTFDRCCRYIACRRRRSFLLLRNLRLPGIKTSWLQTHQSVFLLKMFTWERTSNLQASIGDSKKENLIDITRIIGNDKSPIKMRCLIFWPFHFSQEVFPLIELKIWKIDSDASGIRQTNGGLQFIPWFTALYGTHVCKKTICLQDFWNHQYVFDI